MHRRLTRIVLAAALGLTASIGFASSAGGYQQNMIRQIHPSNPFPDFGGEWVELQMYADGQNAVQGKVIRTFDPSGFQFSLYVIGTGPGPHPGAPNGENQRTILISSLFTPAPGVNADFVAPPGDLQMTGEDGAVCFTENNPPAYTPIDCVAYGNFTGSIPDIGTPAVRTPFESTLERGIARGCPTALDPLDDSNNSSADFALSTRPPRNNSTPPTETLCPPGSPGSISAPIPPGGVTVCAGKPITLSGTNGADKLSGTPGADVIAGQLGNDVIKGLAGKDVLCGGLGKDTLRGGKGNDKLLGEGGKDTLEGGPGKDKLKGGPGADTLKGGPGKDGLKGGPGKDVQIQ
jgi:RTX calcium-binding nonapeptide repeat (4 copies)